VQYAQRSDTLSTMVVNRPGAGAGTLRLGPALSRAWVGYQRRLDDAMTAAGFDDRGFPDGRVLRMCRDGGTTIAQIGRELGITRQGAAKVVAHLRERGYVTVVPSPASGREKVVALTPRAVAYIGAHRDAVRRIDRRLRRALGPDGLTALGALLSALGTGDDDRLRDYLREKGVRDL
jgi:DNA-binding MarR family transcriptional regulator